MKFTKKIVMVWSGLALGSAIHGMSFNHGDRVILSDPRYKNEIATVEYSFSQMWPGERISSHSNNALVADYLKNIPLDLPAVCTTIDSRLDFIAYKGLRNNLFGSEKLIYHVRNRGEAFLTHHSWMRKIPDNMSIDNKKSEQEKKTTAAVLAAATATAPAAKK